MDTSSEKLPRGRVIRRRSIFDAARAGGKRTSNRWMTLSVLPRRAEPDAEPGSVAFLTPKRLGGAVVRNQLRRRMREIFRRELKSPVEGCYLIWIARPPAVELPFPELKECMAALLHRASEPPVR